MNFYEYIQVRKDFLALSIVVLLELGHVGLSVVPPVVAVDDHGVGRGDGSRAEDGDDLGVGVECRRVRDEFVFGRRPHDVFLEEDIVGHREVDAADWCWRFKKSIVQRKNPWDSRRSTAWQHFAGNSCSGTDSIFHLPFPQV